MGDSYFNDCGVIEQGIMGSKPRFRPKGLSTKLCISRFEVHCGKLRDSRSWPKRKLVYSRG